MRSGSANPRCLRRATEGHWGLENRPSPALSKLPLQGEQELASHAPPPRKSCQIYGRYTVLACDSAPAKGLFNLPSSPKPHPISSLRKSPPSLAWRIQGSQEAARFTDPSFSGVPERANAGPHWARCSPGRHSLRPRLALSRRLIMDWESRSPEAGILG